MLFRTHLLQVDPASVGSIKYFLMLTQTPSDGLLEARSVVEGAHVGYLSADSLKESFGRANVSNESIEQLDNALSLTAPIAYVGVVDLDPGQLRELGFLTLAKMVEVRALVQA
jgi:homoserine acetyltransferase